MTDTGRSRNTFVVNLKPLVRIWSTMGAWVAIALLLSVPEDLVIGGALLIILANGLFLGLKGEDILEIVERSATKSGKSEVRWDRPNSDR